jgi:aldehyde dehydrogenase (NAD+)
VQGDAASHDGRDGSTDLHTVLGPYPPIDRTPKMFVGGRQVRPDSGYSRGIVAPDGRIVGEVGAGNRKDIRNAVEAAHAATGWAASTAHARAQILYYVAENLSARGDEFERRLEMMTGRAAGDCSAEVGTTIKRLFAYAAWADKFDGRVHATPLRGVTLLLQFVSLVAPAIAMGNAVVAVPSERYPLSATDLYQVLETSDVPAGVVNIVTGERDALARVLAEHDDVDAVWYAGSAEGAAMVEWASAGNLKRTWILSRPPRDWMDHDQGQGAEFLREATHVKNIWVPSGD